MRHLVCFVFLSLLFSCRKDPSLWKISNLSGDRVMVYGHGGMGYRSPLPMNSKASLCASLESGADGTELDLQLTKDSVLLAFHDKELQDATDCDGEIKTKNAADITNCKYRKGNKKHAIISADEFFKTCPGNSGQIFTLECKIAPGDEQVFARALIRLISSHGLQERCLIEAISIGFLRQLKEMLPSLQTYIYCSDHRDAIDLKDTARISGLTIDMNKINSAQVKEAHAAGLKVTVFNAATDAENIKALQLSPDHIQTDRLEHLVEIYVKRRD